jgi:hypothetical protein
MGGIGGFWVLAFGRNLRKRIGCGFVLRNSLPNTRNCGRAGPAYKHIQKLFKVKLNTCLIS